MSKHAPAPWNLEFAGKRGEKELTGCIMSLAPDLVDALRDLAMAFGHPEDEASLAWWEERAEEAMQEGRSSDWYRNEARAKAYRVLSPVAGQ